MAKIIKYRQDYLLPEYELLRKKKLCNEEDIREIQNKRAEFLSQIKIPSSTIMDYIAYITYERELLVNINKQAKNNYSNIAKINKLILNNIKQLYVAGLKQFPQDLRFWQAYIIFLKHANLYSVVSRVFARMLMYHSDKAEVWLQAALWEYEEVYNIDRMKDLFLSGLERHPLNESLHKMYFKVMLEEAAKLSTELNLQDNIASGQSLAVARIIVLYETSKKKINNIHYSCKLLKMSEKFLFTQKLQKLIINDIMENYANLPITWNTLAQRELKGFNICDFMDKPANVLIDEKYNDNTGNSLAPKQRSLKTRIELCFDVYVTAVNELQNQEMWNYFLNAMLEINEDLTNLKSFKRSKLIQAFHEAHKANYMSANHYYTYIDILNECTTASDEMVVEVLQTAIARHSISAILWEQYLGFYIKKNKQYRAEEIFSKGCIKLRDEAFPLWKLMLQFYLSRFDLKHKVEPFFNKACLETSENFNQIRLLYLEHSLTTKPLKEVRKIYKKIICISPPFLELHKKMALLEEQRLHPDIENWRQCHNYATHFFGKTSVEAWIDYLKFERDYGNPENMPLIYDRATQILNAEYVDNFILEHANVAEIQEI